MEFSKPGVSILAAFVSIFAMLNTMYISVIDIKSENMPTLSIRQDGDDWFVENIGSGPALDPEVTYRMRGVRGWIKGQILYPMKAGEKIIARKVPKDPIGIRVVYRDIYGNEYTSTLASGRLKVDVDLPFLLKWL
ncbi:MAG: hypothetical protein MRY74_04940 [Neomegalonema sp.]|nr:hypothetical protein [Neomegalonema sp.]